MLMAIGELELAVKHDSKVGKDAVAKKKMEEVQTEAKPESSCDLGFMIWKNKQDSGHISNTGLYLLISN